MKPLFSSAAPAARLARVSINEETFSFDRKCDLTFLDPSKIVFTPHPPGPFYLQNRDPAPCHLIFACGDRLSSPPSSFFLPRDPPKCGSPFAGKQLFFGPPLGVFNRPVQPLLDPVSMPPQRLIQNVPPLAIFPVLFPFPATNCRGGARHHLSDIPTWAARRPFASFPNPLGPE